MSDVRKLVEATDCIVSLDGSVDSYEVVELYLANGWSSASKPKELLSALRGSHSLATARVDGRLIGLANAISDGSLSRAGRTVPMWIYSGTDH